jgi:hypothetical protein
MENSPPGIHAIPAGAFVGCGSVFGTVGPKELAAGVAGIEDVGGAGADAAGVGITGAASAVWASAVRQK